MSTGHIRKRQTKDGKTVYQVILESDKDPITGKRQRQYKTVNGTKKEAEAVLNRMITQINDGGTGIIKPSAIKLSDWLDEWLKLYLPNIEETTRAGYVERVNNRLKPYLGNIPLKNLKNSDIQQWINELKDDGLSPKTIKNVYLNLNAALDKAVILRMLPSNPCNGVELPKLVKYNAQVYNNSEMTQALKAAEGTEMYFLLSLMFTTSLRRGELVALTWDDIDFDNSVIHITRNKVVANGKKISKAPKSKAGIRDLYIGANLLNLLKTERAKYLSDKLAQGAGFVDSNCVIRQKDGKPFSPDSITQKWRRFVKQNNLKQIRLHDLRHTSATAMLSAGVSSKAIQTRLGHSDISTTFNIYAHCLPSVNKEAGEELDKILAI